MKRLICAVVALGVSGSALAWGEREQGALVGAVIGAIIAKESQRPVLGYGSGQVAYGANYGVPGVARVVCQQLPVLDQYGRHVGWVQQCSPRY